MSDMKNILEIISGILTDEQKAVLASALAEEAPATETVPEVTVEIPFMDEVEELPPRKTISEVKNMTVRKPVSKRIPVAQNAPYGTEECINQKGEQYTYIRNAFDGQITKLDEKHEEMKKHFIAHSRSLITAYKAVNGFCGAGPQAITMEEPNNEFANKDGKVFYRWTGEHTAELMDELWPLVVPFKEAMEKAVEEAKAQAEGGDDQ